MATRTFRNKDEAGINITPMLDVVFIMLIFFIVTTTFNKETGLRIFGTNSSTINSDKVKVATIKLDTNYNYTVNGVATTLDGIESLLANLKAANPELKAQIISSKDVETGELVSAIAQIKQNGIQQYTVSSF